MYIELYIYRVFYIGTRLISKLGFSRGLHINYFDFLTFQNLDLHYRYRFEHLYKEITQEATRFLMFLFKKVPLKRPLAEECFDHRWLTQSDFMIKKRERAVFLGNRLKVNCYEIIYL